MTDISNGVSTTRRRELEQRRGARIGGFAFRGHCCRAHIGHFPDGSPAEIFLDAAKPNSEFDALAADAAILISLLLQFGASPAEIGHALRRTPTGEPASLIGAAVDVLTDIGSASPAKLELSP